MTTNEIKKTEININSSLEYAVFVFMFESSMLYIIIGADLGKVFLTPWTIFLNVKIVCGAICLT